MKNFVAAIGRSAQSLGRTGMNMGVTIALLWAFDVRLSALLGAILVFVGLVMVLIGGLVEELTKDEPFARQSDDREGRQTDAGRGA